MVELKGLPIKWGDNSTGGFPNLPPTSSGGNPKYEALAGVTSMLKRTWAAILHHMPPMLGAHPGHMLIA